MVTIRMTQAERETVAKLNIEREMLKMLVDKAERSGDTDAAIRWCNEALEVGERMLAMMRKA